MSIGIKCGMMSSFVDVMLAWDISDSLGLIPFQGGVIDYIEVISSKNVTRVNKVIVIRAIIYKLNNNKGGDVYLLCIAYYLLLASIHVVSPQTYHQMHCGHSIAHSERVKMF